MKRLVLALLLFAAPASAATYWVAPDSASGLGAGSPYRSGADTSSAFPSGPKTLAWFNANAVAGDVCRFKSGDYGMTPILPFRWGTPINRIRYYGFPQDPGAVRVAGIQFGKDARASEYRGDYCTARWITTTSSFVGCLQRANIYSPIGDSIVACRSAVANEIHLDGQYCVFDSLTLTGTVAQQGGQAHWMNLNGKYTVQAESDCVINPVIECSVNELKNSTLTIVKSGTGDFHALYLQQATHNLIYNNTFNITVNANTGWFFPVEGYSASDNLFQGNTWNITMNVTPDGSRGVISWRDRSSRNRVLGNTFTVTGASTPNSRGSTGMSFMLTNSGSLSCEQTTISNYFGFNTVKIANPQESTGVLWYYDGTRADTVEFNTIATSSTLPALSVSTEFNGSVFRHNTFFTAGSQAVVVDSPTTSINSPRFSSNVYYCQTANSTTATNMKVPTGTDIDSAGTFFSLGASSAANAISYNDTLDAPGGVYGGAESVWGSPRLADSTYAALNALAVPPSYAVGTNFRDGFAGIGIGGGDQTDPVVTVTYPDTLYLWSGYETMPMAFSATDDVAVSTIDIEWGYRSDPTTWYTAVTGLASGTTTYNLVLPSLTYSYMNVRVKARDAAGNVGEKQALFKCNVSEGVEDSPQYELP